MILGAHGRWGAPSLGVLPGGHRKDPGGMPDSFQGQVEVHGALGAGCIRVHVYVGACVPVLPSGEGLDETQAQGWQVQQ